jgi:RNA polymerase sigma factor (sigma-70 family)
LHCLVRELRQTAESQQFHRFTDTELLERFQATADPEAFAEIIRRYGRPVLATCRKVLPSDADVEDAFQATFLVLLRSSGAIREGKALAGWLCGVAHRVALKAQAATVRRQRAEQRGRRTEEQALDLSWREACAILHEELDRLPDTYRLPLLLCYLEGRSRDEAAQQLGCKLDVFRGRLERGRDRLRDRLTRRGVTLSAGLLTAVAGSTQAGAPTAPLVQATVEMMTSGKTPAAVAALACGGGSTMINAKLKLVAGLMLLAGMVAGMAGSHTVAPAGPQPLRPIAAAPERAAEAPAKPAEEESLTLAGQVQGPDGKPVAGVKLFVPRLKKNPPTSKDDIAVEQVGTTGDDGRFKVTFKNPAVMIRNYLVAHADGLGVDWIELGPDKPVGENVMFRLVKDQPITGRILDTEGKPVAGVTVGIDSVYIPENEKLDGYLEGWKKDWREVASTPVKRLYLPLKAIAGVAKTDKDGRFKLTGAGVERIIHVSISGRGVGQMTPYVLTRAGLDPKPYNEAALKYYPPEFRMKGQTPILYGPEATIVVETGRVAEGVVKELGNGKPLAGVTVGSLSGFGDTVMGVTDANGKYRLEGLPQDKTYHVFTTPPKGSPYIRRSATAEAEPGNGPVRIDIELARGVIVTGQVIDRQTGKGVESGIRFAPLPENKHFGKPGFDSYRTDHTMEGTDKQGRFRVVTIPGKSVLMAQTHGREKVDDLELCPYLRASPDPDYKDLFRYQKDDDTWLFTAANGGLEFLSVENAVKVVDLKEDGGEVQVTLHVERGQTAQLVVQDADGKPLDGVIVAGVTAHWPITYRVKTMEKPATVYALDPEKPRRLVLLHPEKKLGGTVTIRGEKEPVVARLGPLGAVTARFLELEGGPLAGAEVSLNCPDQIASELYRHLDRTGGPTVKTDNEGRFTLSGVVPGVKFYLQTRKGRTYYVGEPKIGLREVEPGKTLDLGDWKLKPQN